MNGLFNDDAHAKVLSEDGSFTAYSKEYEEHYHSTRDGAFKESLLKHVIPAAQLINKQSINILDICYGLGFNTFCTLWYYKKNHPDIAINIYSPELDTSLVKSLAHFTYPPEFEEFENIIWALSERGVYKKNNVFIELFLGDARVYIKKFTDKFDIVYQDAFSPDANPMLWTKEYFSDIKKAMKQEGVLTTYSIALKTRLALYENGFHVYINRGDDFRDATLASLEELEGFELVDMPHKIACNPNVVSLRD